MSVATSTIWEFNTAATASMVNGGGFNYQATGPLNDGSWGAANTASPTLSSATYTFVAGDVGNWIYSTNTTIPGFYKIDSVSTGIATLDAGAGAGVIFDTTTQVWKPNTTDGVDASATVSSKSFLVECCYLVDFVTPLPTTGHIWFMQTLAMCYIAMFAASHNKIVGKWFTSPIKLLLMFIIIIICGFIYRGAYMVYIFFYLLVYYNANRIKNMMEKINIIVLITLLFIGYLLLSTKYYELFHYGIYLQYIQLCIMAIVNILFFDILCRNCYESKLINKIGNISMEIYLTHHFIVYNYPLYISIPVTLILSMLLYQTSIYTKKIMNRL